MCSHEQAEAIYLAENPGKRAVLAAGGSQADEVREQVFVQAKLISAHLTARELVMPQGMEQWHPIHLLNASLILVGHQDDVNALTPDVKEQLLERMYQRLEHDPYLRDDVAAVTSAYRWVQPHLYPSAWWVLQTADAMAQAIESVQACLSPHGIAQQHLWMADGFPPAISDSAWEDDVLSGDDD